MDKMLIEKIYKLGEKIRDAESLNKALIICMEEDYIMTKYDNEHIAEILLTITKNLREDFKDIDQMIVNLSGK